MKASNSILLVLFSSLFFSETRNCSSSKTRPLRPGKSAVLDNRSHLGWSYNNCDTTRLRAGFHLLFQQHHSDWQLTIQVIISKKILKELILTILICHKKILIWVWRCIFEKRREVWKAYKKIFKNNDNTDNDNGVNNYDSNNSDN